VNRRGGLGRGLAALIPPGEHEDASMLELPVAAIRPNPRQPREVFDEEELDGLATSIRDIGLLQPLVVRPLQDETYELIAGERRLRAAKLAGIETLPALVRHTDDADLLKEALVENIHRVQLNPLEEAAAYQQLLEEFDVHPGRARDTPGQVASLDQQRPAPAGAARPGAAPGGGRGPVRRPRPALLAIGEPTAQERLAERIVAEGLSVRATEELVRLRLLEEEGGQDASPRPRSRDRSSRVTAPGLVELQEDLSDALMARVKISMGARKGRLQVEFTSVTTSSASWV
jgi:ParB family transcriptional regulator, chromosome partitioning protein